MRLDFLKLKEFSFTDKSYENIYTYFSSNKESCNWCAFIVKGLKAIVESSNSSRFDDKVMAMKLPFMLKMVALRLLIIEL